MAKDPKPKKSSTASPAKSGAVGGPSTGHGVAYQIDYAVFLALEAMSQCLAIPTKQWLVRVEPRAFDLYGITRWDFGISPPDCLFEAKLNPTKQEILEWLDNLKSAGTAHPGRQLNLVYSKGSGPLLVAIKHLIRMAKEAYGDGGKFQALVDAEAIKDGKAILSRLGTDAFRVLERTFLIFMPEECLRAQIDIYACMLAGAQAGKRLQDYLFRKFHDGIWTRGTFAVADIIREIEHDGITLHAPPIIHDADLSSESISTIHILQSCTAPVPTQVVIEAIGQSLPSLEGHLKPVAGSIVEISNGIISIKPLPRQLSCPNGDDVLGRALESVLGFIRQHKRQDLGKDQVWNAIELARKCLEGRPKTVAGVFSVLDKLLKARGDKHLVLEVAELSINGARHAPPSVEVTKGEVQALICGRAWVYQRIGRLLDARAAAELSLSRGQAIGWTRNTAFCKKCIGRLHRIEAEDTFDADARTYHLDASVTKLKEAIVEFESCPDADLGAGCPEIGDCYSLLGRTYLAAGRIKDSLASAQEARRLIEDPTSKDHMDLAIFLGDLEVATGNREGADTWYDEVIALASCDNAERSEIRARAYFARGLNRAVRNLGSASIDFSKAAEIWKSLDEREWAAKADWERIRLGRNLPDSTFQLLEKERALVRVTAYKDHEGLVANVTGGRTRSASSDQYWQRRVKEAIEKVGIEEKDW